MKNPSRTRPLGVGRPSEWRRYSIRVSVTNDKSTESYKPCMLHEYSFNYAILWLTSDNLMFASSCLIWSIISINMPLHRSTLPLELFVPRGNSSLFLSCDQVVCPYIAKRWMIPSPYRSKREASQKWDRVCKGYKLLASERIRGHSRFLFH